MRLALNALTTELRAQVRTLKGFYPCRDIYERELLLMALEDPEKLAALREMTHPLVRVHAVTGEEALYLNEKWLVRIAGWPEPDSRELLQQLYRISTDDALVHVHRWQIGDLLIWDNSLMMHKAMPPRGDSIKTTYRITVATD